MELEQKLKNLKELRKGSKDLDMINTLTVDIRNIERVMEVEREARSSGQSGIFPPPGRAARVVAPSGESDIEFRERATKELERVAEV